MKSLLDALQIPGSCNQVDGDPLAGEDPFFCLLQDDGLVTEIKVTTDRLLMPLKPSQQQNDVFLEIGVKIKPTAEWS